MNILAEIPTEELLKAYQGGARAAPQEAAPESGDLSSMSTEQLLKMYQGTEAKPEGVKGQISLPLIGKPSLIGMAKGLFETGKSAVALPRDVYQGKVDPLSDQGIKRATDMASLTMLPSARTVASRPATKALPAEQIENVTSQGYKALTDEMRAIPIAPRHMRTITEQVEGHANHGPRRTVAPQAYKHIDSLDEGLDAGHLMDVRSNLQALRREVGGAEGSAAKRAVELVDDYIEAIGTAVNKAPGAAQHLKDLDKNWAIQHKVKEMEVKLENALERASGSGGGGNTGNALRQAFRPVLEKARKGGPESLAEMAALKDIQRPGIGMGIARGLSAFDPFQGKMSTMLHGLAALGSGGATLATAPVGMVARGIYDRGIRKRVDAYLEALRSQAPASRSQPGYQPGGNVGVPMRLPPPTLAAALQDY